MKNLFLTIAMALSMACYSQQDSISLEKPYKQKITIENREQPWSLSTSLGYINIPQPNLGNNVWGSVNIGYSKKNWNMTFWTGTNYWIEGRQPDLRIGLSTTYTIIKW